MLSELRGRAAFEVKKRRQLLAECGLVDRPCVDSWSTGRRIAGMPSPSPAAAESVAERMYLAVKALATARGDVRSRLEIAGSLLTPLRADEFPMELQRDFEWVMTQLTRFEPRFSEGRIAATMKRIQNMTGEKIATRIFEIYERIQRMRGRSLL